MTFDNSCMCLPFLSHHNFQPDLPAYAPMMPVKRQTGGERFFPAQSASVTILATMLNKLKECVWYCGGGGRGLGFPGSRLYICWLVGCFGFNGPLKLYFNLYRAVSQREAERGENGKKRIKMSKQPPPAPTASAVGPCPGTGSLSSTIAPPDHPKTLYLIGLLQSK